MSETPKNQSLFPRRSYKKHSPVLINLTSKYLSKKIWEFFLQLHCFFVSEFNLRKEFFY